jgi:hypothetical protein
MLFKAPRKAIALSDVTNEFKSLFANSAGAANAWEYSNETNPAIVFEERCMARKI